MNRPRPKRHRVKLFCYICDITIIIFHIAIMTDQGKFSGQQCAFGILFTSPASADFSAGFLKNNIIAFHVYTLFSFYFPLPGLEPPPVTIRRASSAAVSYDIFVSVQRFKRVLKRFSSSTVKPSLIWKIA